jgi:hypothetical protein
MPRRREEFKTKYRGAEEWWVKVEGLSKSGGV